MSFESMRQHQKKIWLPLAVVIIIAFVFLGYGPSSGAKSMLEGSRSASLSDELVRLGQDLQSAGMIYPPPVKWYKARAERERSHIKDPKALKKAVGKDVSARIRAYFQREGAQRHYLPALDGERLGVTITDVDLSERVREMVEERWRIKPFDKKAYAEECSSRSLSETRFEALVRGQMIRERVVGMLTMTAGASESEIFAAYARDKQKVRVQYFQRDTRDFIGKVQILPGKRPEEKKPEDAEKPEKKASDDKGDKEKAKKPKPGKIYEAEIKEKFDKQVERLKTTFKYNKDNVNFEWPAWAARQSPEFFTDPTVKIEYLVALGRNFRRGIKVTDKEIEDEYNDNKTIKYRLDPKDDTKFKPLDRKLKKEIEEQLIKEKAGDAAVKALEAAVKAYNTAKPEDRPKDEASWKPFLKKHRVTRKVLDGATEAVIRKTTDFKKTTMKAGDLFDEKKRKELKADFAPYVRMEDGRGHFSCHLLEYNKREMLSFEKVKAGFTYRLKRLEAWDMAEEAIEADLTALKKDKSTFDSKRVRESVLLDPSSEVAQAVRTNSLSIGQVSTRFAYRELLGPAAEKKKAEDEKKEKEKEKEEEAGKSEEKPKTLEERITDSLDRDLRGYRAIILIERSVPTFEDFRKDRAWRKRWKPATPLEEYYLRYVQRRAPKDSQWRESFIQGYFAEKYEQLLSKAN